MEKLVLDTSAFIQGVIPSDGVRYYTPPSVKEEIKNDLNRIRYENLRRMGTLEEVSPHERYLRKVAEVSMEMGEETLSITDIDILALGLQLRASGEEVKLVSDDYSVQNIADRLGLKCISLATPGIKKQLTWTIYCPGCKRSFDISPRGGICPICGTELKRKPHRDS
ncbi:MAG: NOB1 family endonuclease [Candidatus Bathyarchaeia archaeon]